MRHHIERFDLIILRNVTQATGNSKAHCYGTVANFTLYFSSLSKVGQVIFPKEYSSNSVHLL